MNKVLRQIHAHRSIRRFKEKEVDDSTLNVILEAATAASSSGNMQVYSIIVTREKGMKEKIFKAHFEQSMLMEAPIFLTFCADFNRMRKWIQIREAANNFDNYMSFMIASIDAILASQNAALAAESLGLGICYMGTTLASAHEIGMALELPHHVVPVVGFALGYPDESPDKRKRLPLEAIVHNEKYQDYSEESVLKIYEEKERLGRERYSENLAKIYTEKKYTEESHLKYSENLLNFLFSQKFIQGSHIPF